MHTSVSRILTMVIAAALAGCAGQTEQLSMERPMPTAQQRCSTRQADEMFEKPE